MSLRDTHTSCYRYANCVLVTPEEVRHQVLNCTSCSLRRGCKAPVPYAGPEDARLVVLGEAPGPHEDEAGKPFSGPSGLMLRSMMARVGLKPDSAVFMDVISCVPTTHNGKGRAPTAKEIAACQPNLMAQLELIDPTFILLVGTVALNALRPGLKISQARGVPIMLGGTRDALGSRLAIPTFHPAYVMHKGGENSSTAGLVQDDLRFLLRFMESEDPKAWTKLLPDACVLCDEFWTMCSDDGLGFCDAHEDSFLAIGGRRVTRT